MFRMLARTTHACVLRLFFRYLPGNTKPPASAKKAAQASLICARPRIGGALVRSQPAGRGIIETALDPIAERRPRRGRVALLGRRIHLRYDRDFDPRRWRRSWHRRI